MTEPENKDIIKFDANGDIQTEEEVHTEVPVLQKYGENGIRRDYEGASDLKLNPEEEKGLLKPFDEAEIDIRPDGLIYLPTVYLRKRLNQVLGIGQWALIRRAEPMIKDNKCIYPAALYIRGKFASESIGGAEYHTSNPNQNWDDVVESARTDALSRCCKDIGLNAECWEPVFGEKWIKKYATKVWRNKAKNKFTGQPGAYQWRRINKTRFYDETPTTMLTDASTKPATASEVPQDTIISDRGKTLKSPENDYMTDDERLAFQGFINLKWEKINDRWQKDLLKKWGNFDDIKSRDDARNIMKDIKKITG